MVIAAGVGATILVCSMVAWATGVDPMTGFEVASAVSIAAWLVLVAHNVWRGRELALAIASRSIPVQISGIRCRLIVGADSRAFVLGAIRPAIYVGQDLIDTLDADELRAVLLHEEFHQRTWGPLRSASLEAWMTLTQPLRRLREPLADRFVDLERAADLYALRHGATTAGIASALLRVDGVEAWSVAAFSNAADRRIGGLLELAAGRPGTPGRLPYEWLPPAVAAIVLLLCHVVEGPFPG